MKGGQTDLDLSVLLLPFHRFLDRRIMVVLYDGQGRGENPLQVWCSIVIEARSKNDGDELLGNNSDGKTG